MSTVLKIKGKKKNKPHVKINFTIPEKKINYRRRKYIPLEGPQRKAKS